MFRLLFRILVLLVLFLTVRSILSRIFEAARGPGEPPSPRKAPPAVEGGELKQDPICGAYVPVNTSLNRKVRGEFVYFCSEECRDKFVA